MIRSLVLSTLSLPLLACSATTSSPEESPQRSQSADSRQSASQTQEGGAYHEERVQIEACKQARFELVEAQTKNDSDEIEAAEMNIEEACIH
ncbi:hypothetical protein CA267_006475 [Alteromonas pelagimontana]|uniref:Secreted protein n=1 Tax=Alteromonas pelagimontana TaxID=1858656 RepID=A0A6M4MB80_9ALTE|nr:hypothetical protein [Alteromonas pelagimontana]QJR80442.1 hypothetical protein CA267_006475 [Alteromonas pelagimontana]